ncbi:hypothetical protein [Brevibacterium litoralis]|uniref:hypothetical protein n=1 Tax=Brevibacterium litoralis TaxID=3138935 RepID=UPI0032EC2D7D
MTHHPTYDQDPQARTASARHATDTIPRTTFGWMAAFALSAAVAIAGTGILPSSVSHAAGVKDHNYIVARTATTD